MPTGEQPPDATSLHIRRAVTALGFTALGVGLGLGAGRYLFDASLPGHSAQSSTAELVELEAFAATRPASGQRRSAVASRPNDAGLTTRTAPEEAQAAVPATPEELEAFSEAYGDARRALLDELLDASPRSTAAEHDAALELARYEAPSGMPSPAVLSTRCSRDLCRFELHHTETGAGHRMFRALWTSTTFRGAGFVTERPASGGGGYVTRIYVGQGDFEPPRPEMAGG